MYIRLRLYERAGAQREAVCVWNRVAKREEYKYDGENKSFSMNHKLLDKINNNCWMMMFPRATCVSNSLFADELFSGHTSASARALDRQSAAALVYTHASNIIE